MRGHRVQNKYTINFDKKIQEAMRNAKASPFGSNSDDRRQRRKQGEAVGAAASRMRATAKQTLGAATRAVALRSNDGEGKPVSREPPRSDRQALCQSDTIAAQSCLAASLPSQALTRQLPQRGSPWQAGQVYAGRAKHDVSETVVLRCLGQRQLDKERLYKGKPALCSKARPFAPYRTSGVQRRAARPAKGSLTRGAVCEAD